MKIIELGKVVEVTQAPLPQGTVQDQQNPIKYRV